MGKKRRPPKDATRQEFANPAEPLAPVTVMGVLAAAIGGFLAFGTRLDLPSILVSCVAAVTLTVLAVWLRRPVLTVELNQDGIVQRGFLRWRRRLGWDQVRGLQRGAAPAIVTESLPWPFDPGFSSLGLMFDEIARRAGLVADDSDGETLSREEIAELLKLPVDGGWTTQAIWDPWSPRSAQTRQQWLLLQILTGLMLVGPIAAFFASVLVDLDLGYLAILFAPLTAAVYPKHRLIVTPDYLKLQKRFRLTVLLGWAEVESLSEQNWREPLLIFCSRGRIRLKALANHRYLIGDGVRAVLQARAAGAVLPRMSDASARSISLAKASTDPAPERGVSRGIGDPATGPSHTSSPGGPS